MDSNASTQQIIDLLTGITARLDRLERATGRILMEVMGQSPNPPQHTAGALPQDGAILLLKLGQLTLKRHAVLSATLGGLSYNEIAQHLGCDVSTVKAHMRYTLQILGITSRSILLSSHRDLLECLDDAQYRAKFGLTKRWWADNEPSVIASLQATRPSANQHTRAKQTAP